MKNKKVLIVEDNALNRRVFEHIIGQGYLYDIAENGLEAIDKIKSESYDLILMDIQMPLLDGISAIKIIKEEQLTTIPIIAISAYASPGDRDYFLSAGFDDFIAKPVKPKLLLETIGNNINKTYPMSEDHSALKSDQELDYEVVKQLLKYNSPENIKIVFTDFLEECYRLLSEIESLIKDEEYPEIGEKLHILKGNSGTLGAMRIYNFTNAFERNIKNSIFDDTFKDYLNLVDLVNKFNTHIHSQHIF
jgi:two-component system, OmpR family, alkaline phosphatase synthesis response regulator PhoP